MRLAVRAADGTVKAEVTGEGILSLVYHEEFTENDQIVLNVDEPGEYMWMPEDTMGMAQVYVEKEAVFTIPPVGEKRVCYSTRSFIGTEHLITARKAGEHEKALRRNLALNPLDQHGDTGMYPHAKANVETRGEALFAARNAIDGIYANHNHYPYPYQSWGINRNPDAELTLDFGREVMIDGVAITLRMDRPHDSYWTQATVVFSDGTTEVFPLVETDQPQYFAIQSRKVRTATLCKLIKAGDESPFPALTQIEYWGTNIQ